MKKIVIIIVAAFLFAPVAIAFGGAKETMKITVIGAVWHKGPQQVPMNTSLADVLNTAVCHKESIFWKIRVTRKTADKIEVLTVEPTDKKKGEVENFSLQDGDLIEVPDKWFDPNGHKVRVVVKGPFVLKKSAKGPYTLKGSELASENNAPQGGTDQSTTAPDSKPEGKKKPKPESEGRSK